VTAEGACLMACFLIVSESDVIVLDRKEQIRFRIRIPLWRQIRYFGPGY